MRRAAAIAAFLCLVPVRAAVPGGPGPGERGTFDATLERVSRRFLGAPYRLGPLGEEAWPDADPRFRLDVFDCTTYVETVLALSLSETGSTASGGAAGAGEAAAGGAVASDGESREPEEAARRWLDRIRYSGTTPTFAARRHLVDSQWIPELIAAKLLRDVTREIGGRETRAGSLRLRRDSWERSALARELGLAWSAVPHGRHDLAYLPWHLLERDVVRAALPPVAVLSLVAAPHPDVPTLVTHQGLLLRGAGGEVTVRHASSRTGRVAEEPLDRFVERSRALRRRTVLGVNVLVVVDPQRPAAD